MSETNTKRMKRVKAQFASDAMGNALSVPELASLGGGHLAYIKMLTPDEAERMFPAVEGLPKGINIYALNAADGTPIALTDTMQAAIGHAMGGELEIASVH